MNHSDQPFAPGMQEIARAHLEALLASYSTATGLKEGTIGKLVQGDPKWAPGFRGRNIGIGTYDQSVRRFSAVWPEGVEWPDAVPRQAPEMLSPEALTKLNARLGARAPVHHSEDRPHG